MTNPDLNRWPRQTPTQPPGTSENIQLTHSSPTKQCIICLLFVLSSSPIRKTPTRRLVGSCQSARPPEVGPKKPTLGNHYEAERYQAQQSEIFCQNLPDANIPNWWPPIFLSSLLRLVSCGLLVPQWVLHIGCYILYEWEGELFSFEANVFIHFIDHIVSSSLHLLGPSVRFIASSDC